MLTPEEYRIEAEACLKLARETSAGLCQNGTA